MEEDKERLEKQKYLKENILDKNYDAEIFTKFMNDQRDDGINIDNWTLEELKEIVDVFYLNYESLSLSHKDKEHGKIDEKVEKIPQPIDQKENTTDIQNKNNENELTVEALEKGNNMENEEKILEMQNKEISTISEIQTSQIQEKEDFIIPHYDLNKLLIIPPIPSYDYTKLLEKKNDFFDSPINVTIIKYKKEVITEILFFSTTYLFFCIETNPLNWQVYRKFEDCIWLRDNLQKYFPFLVLPPINVALKGGISSEDAENQRKELNKFFLELTKIKIVKQTDIFLKFLSIENYNEFTKIKNSYDKERFPNSYQKIEHINGKVRIHLSEKVLSECDNINEFAKKAEEAYDKIKSTSCEVTQLMAFLSEAFNKHSKAYDNFCELLKHFNSHGVNEIFENLGTHYYNLSKWLRTVCEQRKIHFENFFDYYKLEIGPLKKASQRYEEQLKLFFKSEHSLKKSKIKLYKGQIIENLNSYKDLKGKLSENVLQEMFLSMLPKVS